MPREPRCTSPRRAGRSSTQACPGKPRPVATPAPTPSSFPCRSHWSRSPRSTSPRPQTPPSSYHRAQKRPRLQQAASTSTRGVQPKLTRTQKRRLRRKREDARRKLQLGAALDSVAATAARRAQETARAAALQNPSPDVQPEHGPRQTDSRCPGNAYSGLLSDISSLSSSDTE